MKIIKDRQKRTLGQTFYNDKNLFHDGVRNLTFDTSSETYVDVTGSDITVYFEKDTSVLLFISGQIQSDTEGYIAYMQLVIDDIAELPEGKSTDSGEPEILTVHFVKDLEKGAHTFKLQTKISDSTAEANLTQGSISVILLSER